MANLSNINGKFVVEQTTGFVGIGTTDPAYLLHVNSSDIPNGTRIIIENTNGSGKKYGLLSDNTGVFTVRDITAGADRFSISTLGNATFAGDVSLADDKKIRLGTGNDLQIYHNGSQDRIESSSAFLVLEASNVILRNNGGSEDYAKFLGNAAVELYYNNSKKFETTSTGVSVTGNVTATQGTIGQFTFSTNVLQSNNLNNSGARIRAAVSGETTPTYSFEDDTNTGMFTTGADILKFATGGTTAITIDSSGNVGIGGGTIEGKLSIDYTAAELPTSGTTSNSAIQVISSLNNQLNLGLNTVNGDYGAYIQASDNNLAVPYPLNLQPNGGNVGIGTTSPGARLETKAANTGATTDYSTKVIKATAPLIGGYTGTKIISLLSGFDGGVHAVDFGYGYNTVGYDIMLSTNDNTTGDPIERMRITSRGEVGIGITPNVNSNVVNVIQLGKGMTLLGNANDDRATMAANLYLDTGTAFRYVMDGYAGRFSIEDGNMIWGTAGSGTLGAVATVSTKMTLLNNGNVGIGTTSPGYKLSVANGSTRIVSINYQDNLNTIMSHAGSPNYGLEALTIRGDYIAFYTDYDTSHYQGLERMRITSTGLTTIKRTGITGVAKNDMILQIGYEGNNGQNNLIGFGYNGGTNIPAYIGFTTTSGGGSTQGDLVFATRGVTTDTAPTERMRITSGGQLQLQGSSSSLAKSTTQTQFAYIPGNTPGASLMPENPSGMSSASAGYHIVYGANNSSPYQAFIDVITYQCGSSTNVTVISSTTLNNSPGSRSYSKNSSAVFLNISGAANYNCNIKTTFINLPH